MSGAAAAPVAREPWPDQDLERVERCPACAGADREPLYEGLVDPLFGTPGEWSLWRCRGCGSAFLDPRPTPGSIGRAYSHYFTHEQPAEEEARGPLGRFRRRALHGLLNARYGYRLEPASAWGARLLPLVPRTTALTDRWVRHVHRSQEPARLLDVGCGNGEYLLRMRGLGFDVRGIDVDPSAVGEANRAGLDVRRATLGDLDPGRERYEAITLGHVIEHLPDPAETLRRAHALLSPGGMLWLATPNVDAVAHGVFGRDWYAIDSPRHLVLFSRGALAKLLEAAGFDRVEALTPPPAAGQSFPPSAAIARGLNPLENEPAVPIRLRARAMAADILNSRRPEVAEELIFAAWRGPS